VVARLGSARQSDRQANSSNGNEAGGIIAEDELSQTALLSRSTWWWYAHRKGSSGI
jgi:hypothetical protein